MLLHKYIDCCSNTIQLINKIQFKCSGLLIRVIKTNLTMQNLRRIVIFVAIAFAAVIVTTASPIQELQSDELFDTEIIEENDLPDSNTQELTLVNMENLFHFIKLDIVSNKDIR